MVKEEEVQKGGKIIINSNNTRSTRNISPRIMNRETLRVPKLVDESYFKVPELPPKVKKSVTFQTIPKSIPSGSHSIPSGSHSIPNGTNNKARNSLILNLVILFIFIGFFIFFLYNCKYGMFKNMEIDPVPFSIVSGAY